MSETRPDEAFIDPLTIKVTGVLRQGRVDASHFSQWVGRCAEILGARSDLSVAIESAQEACDHLKSKGFSDTSVDRVVWLINDPFPLSVLAYAERALFSRMPTGVADVNGHMEHIHSGGQLTAALAWHKVSFAEGRAMIGRWDLSTTPGASGAGGKGVSAAIALRSGGGSAQKALIRAGMDATQAKRFIAGHEMGHVIFNASGHDELLSRLMTAMDIDKRDIRGRARVSKTAEELFADALGSLASQPGNPTMGWNASTRMRCERSIWSTPAAIYLRGELRMPVGERLVGGGWNGADGAVDLAAECLAMALSHCCKASPWQIRSSMGQAFAALVGRPWAGVKAAKPRGPA